ncbi:MAG: class I SAM-dependent methyltransferase [Myxococcales bacterium]|nr:class I SAM-dependent methyltransferase [Myxococcales bacterium]
MNRDHAADDQHRHAHAFGEDRARHYDANAAIALAGSAVAYELGASAIASALDGEGDASLLFVGVGTGAELAPYARFAVDRWQFTGVDPSGAMIDVARARLDAAGLTSRTRLHVGELSELPDGPPFDGAQMMGVLHHVDGDGAREALLREVARRIRPGAPLVIGCRVGMDPVLVDIELRRLRALGVAMDDLARRRAMFSLMKPVASDGALHEMLARAGFEAAKAIFLSLQYKVFVARRAEDR